MTIPDFLLSPRFLKTGTRFETLPQAKALLREMNASRSIDDQLIFFSYESRHLGTPDNNNSFRRLLIVATCGLVAILAIQLFSAGRLVLPW